MTAFRRSAFDQLRRRLSEPRRFIQVLSGPRQCGKTTIVRQVIDECGLPSHYATADSPTLRDHVWIEQQWEVARARLAGEGRRGRGALLVFDEIQKVSGWSEAVKRQWDADTAARRPLRVVVLGSAPLIVQKGLTESLAGRFERIPVTHWSFAEMREAFGWNVDQYIFHGGYPGSASLIDDPARWSAYIVDSLIETTIARDILLLTRIDKPALLRRLFELACRYSGQVLSYQKMTGQLQDAGNTTTLAHYLDLLGASGFVTGLPKFAGERVRQRAASPKLMVYNTALLTAQDDLTLAETKRQPDRWGHLVESAVGAHLLNEAVRVGAEVFYWRERGQEVDFVLRHGRTVTAIEVKSGRRKNSLPGIGAFLKENPRARPMLVGADGMPVEQFLATPIDAWSKR